MQRICFVMHIDPDRVEDYRERHLAVRPEMLREIEASGRRNYSLFLHPGGMVIGYFETDDLTASTEYLANSPIAAAWEAQMQPFFTDVAGRADQSLAPLPEIFNLTDQLAASDITHRRNGS